MRRNLLLHQLGDVDGSGSIYFAITSANTVKCCLIVYFIEPSKWPPSTTKKKNRKSKPPETLHRKSVVKGHILYTLGSAGFRCRDSEKKKEKYKMQKLITYLQGESSPRPCPVKVIDCGKLL